MQNRTRKGPAHPGGRGRALSASPCPPRGARGRAAPPAQPRPLPPRRPRQGSPHPAIPYIAAPAAINSPAPPPGAGPGAAAGGFSAAAETRHHPRLGDGDAFLTFDSFLCRSPAGAGRRSGARGTRGPPTPGAAMGPSAAAAAALRWTAAAAP
ncbi:proline-rich protein 2-like [Caloenas nicobarica]|uniref:proline-rich protein 2-like n=1 Tax=Caloenas nicobarica TaxID=187106 RepID=UPI0032B7734D